MAGRYIDIGANLHNDRIAVGLTQVPQTPTTPVIALGNGKYLMVEHKPGEYMGLPPGAVRELSRKVRAFTDSMSLPHPITRIDTSRGIVAATKRTVIKPKKWQIWKSEKDSEEEYARQVLPGKQTRAMEDLAAYVNAQPFTPYKWNSLIRPGEIPRSPQMETPARSSSENLDQRLRLNREQFLNGKEHFSREDQFAMMHALSFKAEENLGIATDFQILDKPDAAAVEIKHSQMKPYPGLPITNGQAYLLVNTSRLGRGNEAVAVHIDFASRQINYYDPFCRKPKDSRADIEKFLRDLNQKFFTGTAAVRRQADANRHYNPKVHSKSKRSSYSNIAAFRFFDRSAEPGFDLDNFFTTAPGTIKKSLGEIQKTIGSKL